MTLLSTGQLIGTLIAALGGGTVVALVLTLKPTRRKIFSEAKKTSSEGEKSDAEATEIIARTATGLMTSMEQNVVLLNRQLAEARQEIEELTRQLRAANKRVCELEDSVDHLTRRLDATAASTPEGGVPGGR